MHLIFSGSINLIDCSVKSVILLLFSSKSIHINSNYGSCCNFINSWIIPKSVIRVLLGRVKLKCFRFGEMISDKNIMKSSVNKLFSGRHISSI
jgi:hypothetical protein